MNYTEAEQIANIVDNSIERSCNTCNDQPMCAINGKTGNIPCKHWKPDFALFQKEWDKAIMRKEGSK